MDEMIAAEINALNATIDDLRRNFLGDGMPEDFLALVQGDEKYAASLLRELAATATVLYAALEVKSEA